MYENGNDSIINIITLAMTTKIIIPKNNKIPVDFQTALSSKK